MKRVIILMSLVVFLFSCKMAKQAAYKEDTKIAIVEQKNFTEKKNETVIDNSVIEDVTNENVKITKFSPPDSTGKQYIKSIVEINKNETLSNNKNIVKTKENTKEDKTKTTENMQTKIEEKSKSKLGSDFFLPLFLGVSLAIVIFLIVKNQIHK